MLKLTLYIEPYSGEESSSGPSRNETILEILKTAIPMFQSLLTPPPRDPNARVASVDAPLPPIFRASERGPHVPDPQEPAFDPEGVVASRSAPPTKETNAVAKEENRRQKKLIHGYETFSGLLNLWAQNFDKEGPQPDRAQAIKDIVADAKAAGAVVTYVMGCGGLVAATKACLPQESHKTKNHRQIAENIAQVASALAFGDLAELLEPILD